MTVTKNGFRETRQPAQVNNKLGALICVGKSSFIGKEDSPLSLLVGLEEGYVTVPPVGKKVNVRDTLGP